MRMYVSVKKALIKGHLMVNVPVIVFLFGPGFLTYYLSEQYILPSWSVLIASLIGFILAWLTWSIMITKWRVWAFENVRNVHELKKKAIEQKLIWEDGATFEKTEIRSKSQKEKLNKLEEKFETEDQFYEDITLASKTEITYTKTHKYFELFGSITLIIGGIYFVTYQTKPGYVLGAFLILLGILSAKDNLKLFLNNKTQLIIDNKGITTENSGFVKWSNIEDEEIIYETDFRNNIKHYLIFYYNGYQNYEKIDIEGLNTSKKELENVIRTYRIRSKKEFRR